LQILEEDIKQRCAVKDCESWKKTSNGDMDSSSLKTRGLQPEEPTEEEIKEEEEEEIRDFKKKFANSRSDRQVVEKNFRIPQK
jgi:hypothetical protein